MIKQFLTWGSWLAAGMLLLFMARRWLFIFFALLPERSRAVELKAAPVSVLLLVPLRNEIHVLPELLPALDQLAYPPEQLTLVFIDDGSTDGSKQLIQPWFWDRANWHLLSLEQSLGKAQALNLALAQFPQGEIVVIYDADERPRPDALPALVLPFADKNVGGVSGRRAASNALASPAASYTTFEELVHQLITMRAKDRLNLAPAILGANCAYRRMALAEVGNFKPAALLEDSDLTLKLAQAGWKIRFEPEAISYHTVPQTVSGYWRQHTRWARGFNEVAKDQAPALLSDRQLPLLLRLELLAFALGYLDRLALLAGGVLSFYHSPARRVLIRIVMLSLLTPLFQLIAALKVGREPAAMWFRIVWLPVFFVLDVAMAATGLWTTLKQSPQIWEERRVRL